MQWVVGDATPGAIRMPGQTSSQLETVETKKSPDRRIGEVVEVLKDLDRRKPKSADSPAPDMRESVGMTSDNYYG